jgi:NADH-quinone oxidoreductase subunit J
VDSLSRLDLTTLIAVIVLGATGTYLLLPHSHGRTKPNLAHRVGYVLTTLSVLIMVLGMMRLWRADVEIVTKAFFYIFAFAAIFGAILTVTSRDPIHSALWFAAVVLATSGLFLLSGAQFLAAGTVIVYAGAIIVTFLFVIMLAQKEGRAIYDRMARSPFLATLAGFLLLFTLLYSLIGIQQQRPQSAVASDHVPFVAGHRIVPATERLSSKTMLSPEQSKVLSRALSETNRLPEVTITEAKGTHIADGTHVASLGSNLFTDHLVTVEVAGALLFVALIGALAIATPRAPIRPTVPVIVSEPATGARLT